MFLPRDASVIPIPRNNYIGRPALLFHGMGIYNTRIVRQNFIVFDFSVNKKKNIFFIALYAVFQLFFFPELIIRGRILMLTATTVLYASNPICLVCVVMYRNQGCTRMTSRVTETEVAYLPRGHLTLSTDLLIALCDITSQKIRTTWQLNPLIALRSLNLPLISPCQPDKRPQSSSIKNDVILLGRVCFMEQIFRTEKLSFPWHVAIICFYFCYYLLIIHSLPSHAFFDLKNWVFLGQNFVDLARFFDLRYWLTSTCKP